MGKVSTFKSQVDNLNFDKIISGQVVICQRKKDSILWDEYNKTFIPFLFFSFLFFFTTIKWGGNLNTISLIWKNMLISPNYKTTIISFVENEKCFFFRENIKCLSRVMHISWLIFPCLICACEYVILKLHNFSKLLN